MRVRPCAIAQVICERAYALSQLPTQVLMARGCSWPEQKVAVSPCNLVTDSYVEKLLSLLDGICTTHVIHF